MKSRGTNESLEAFLNRLGEESAKSFEQTPDREAIRAIVFLHLNRALEAGATLEESAQSLGIATARSQLSHELENLAYDELEILGPMLQDKHGAT